MSDDSKFPLVYACSGASSAAQMANHIAVKLDRLKVAEMSCIAGVGGDVKPLVRTAKSGRPIIALDGCPLHCAAQILKRHGLTADKHYDLSKMGAPKKQHEDFDPAEATQTLMRIQDDLTPAAEPETKSTATIENLALSAASGSPGAADNEPRGTVQPGVLPEPIQKLVNPLP
jgi:uncharacterized metal-binding protein